MPELTPSQAPARWHQSLIVRVVVLCGVLVVCLLGSVYVLTGHYYGEVVRDMDSQASEIASKVQVALENYSGEDVIDFQNVPNDLIELERWVDIEFEPVDEDEEAAPAHPVPDLEGYVFEASRIVPVRDQMVMVTARFTVSPQTEIVRAFKNRYLMALTGVFVVALVAMVYLIVKTLRPLSELSRTCTEISKGKLKTIETRGGASEIRALEDTFNRMVASLRDKEVVETNLRQAQRLSAVGNLAAGVAHDVRNPLNAIKLLSSHAIDTLDTSEENASAIKHLRTIRNEVNRLEEIVSGFLSLAKEEELKREPHAIDDILRECVRLVEKDAETRKVRLTADLRSGDTQLMIDEKHWTRAIINVLINALEACPPGGRVRLFSRMTDQHCEVEVRDDGPGMSRETLEHIFDPYFTTKKTGTGLGLSITRGIIEEHGGTITVTSSEGQGCQVLITVPLPARFEAEPASELV